MNNFPIRNQLTELLAAAGLSHDDMDGPSGSPERLVRLVLDGAAKLPLDRVADLAALLRCDARHLFRLSLAQFYSQDNIRLLETMLGARELNADEEAWLTVIRNASNGEMKPPSRIARGVIRALFGRVP